MTSILHPNQGTDGSNEAPRLSARSLKTLPELLSSLSALQSMETALSASLSTLLEAQEPLRSSLARLNSLEPNLDSLRVEADSLSNKVGLTAQTAERVRGKVQALDEEMSRIREAGERVGLVMDLKSSLSSLQSDIESRDWESATRHCARAMSIPEHITSGAFAESMVPTANSPLPPAQTLAEGREALLRIFRSQFNKAAQAHDSAATTRFFKLFPVIGWEKEGLEAYSDFVIDLVRSRPQGSSKTSSPMHYVTAFTSLFESIAMIVSQHQPVVEKYYGNGKMYNVIKRLIEECDRVLSGLLESWEEDRNVMRKVQDTSNPYFPSLVPAASKKAIVNADIDAADPREIDKLLSELAGMVSRWSLFRRFLYDRLRDDNGGSASPSGGGDDSAPPHIASTDLSPSPTLEERTEMLESSKTRVLFSNVIQTYYLPLETWYLRAIIEKSHRLSTLDTSAQPPQNTTPDDVFYIFKVILSRAISTGSLDAVQGTATAASAILERDFAGIIRSKLDDVHAGKPNPAGLPKGDKAEKENRTTFMILLNDLAVSSSHTETLIRSLVSSPLIPQNFLESEVPAARQALTNILSLTGTLRSMLQAGLEQLFNQLIRPKLRQFVVDMYKDVSYNLDQDAYTTAEYNDVVRKRFIRLWSTLLDGFKDVLAPSNFHAFFLLTVEVLSRHWEKHILGLRFSELGAIRFDRDLRAISGYLSSQVEFGDAREKFQRLQQISTLLNLDEEEDPDEFYSGSGIVWRLSANDARTVVGLRVG